MAASGGARSVPLPQEVMPPLAHSVYLLALSAGSRTGMELTRSLRSFVTPGLSLCPSFWSTGAGPYSEDFMVQ